MTDTSLTPASHSADANGRATSPVHKLRSTELSRLWNERVDKIRKMRDEYESLRQRRMRQLLEAERAAQGLREKLQEERRQRRDEAKRKEDERRSAAEERRRQLEAEEKSKLEESLRRSTDRESRFDSLKRRAGKDKYAFGSSLPRDFGSLFGSASASASRAESDYEDNLTVSLSTKTSRSASPRREKERLSDSRKERRALSTGPGSRRVLESPALSLAPDGSEVPRASRIRPPKASAASVMSTSMLVEYHSSLMPVSGEPGDAHPPHHTLSASQHRLEFDSPSSASAIVRRTLALAKASASASGRNATPLDRGISPLRVSVRNARVSPARSALRSDEQLLVTVPIDDAQTSAYSAIQSRLLAVRSLRAATNGETDTSESEAGTSHYASRLRKPQNRAASPRKTVARGGESAGRSQKQSSSPSRIPVSMRNSRASRLERSHSAGASDVKPERRSRAAAANLTSSLPRPADSSHSVTSTPRNAPSSAIPKPIRPRSADPERRNRLNEAAAASAASAATAATEGKNKNGPGNSHAGADPMKDSISTPKRTASPSKLPQSLRSKPTSGTTASEEVAPPPPIRPGFKSPLKTGITAPLQQAPSASAASASTPPVTNPTVSNTPPVAVETPAVNGITTIAVNSGSAPKPVPPSPTVLLPSSTVTSASVTTTTSSTNGTLPAQSAVSVMVTKQMPDANGVQTLPNSVTIQQQQTVANAQSPPVAKSTNPQVAAPSAIPSGPTNPPATTTTTATATAPQGGDSTSGTNASGGWMQFEQAMLAKRSEQLEEEWQKLKSEEERKQRDLTDRERALKAREAQLAELEKERLARKERLKNIMTRVRPGADELDAPADASRAQSMSMLSDLRSQQLGLFGATAPGPSTSSVLDAALQREAARGTPPGPQSCAEVEFAGAWAPSRRVMFAQAPLVLGGQQPSAPVSIQRAAHNTAVVNSILRSSRLAQGAAELSSSAPPGVGGLAALGGISSLLQLRRQVEAAAAAANGARQHAPPSGPS